MPSVPTQATWDQGTGDLVSQAVAVLTQEIAKMSASGTPLVPPMTGNYAPAMPAPASAAGAGRGNICPVTGATPQLQPQGLEGLQKQASALLTTLVANFGSGGAGKGLSSFAHAASNVAPLAAILGQPGKLLGPLSGARPSDPLDALRRQAHEFIETLLLTFNDATGEKGLPAEDQVPLMTALAATQAGEVAHATLRVVNDEPTANRVSLYASNFIGDSGYEIASMHLQAAPRVADIPPKSEVTFEIAVTIPPQTPAGWYSALIQASGCKYVKAVLSIEVL